MSKLLEVAQNFLSDERFMKLASLEVREKCVLKIRHLLRRSQFYYTIDHEIGGNK